MTTKYGPLGQCCKYVRGSGMWDGRHRCERNAALIAADGKGYCKQHDPVAEAARDAAAMARHNEKTRIWIRQRQAEAACSLLTDAQLDRFAKHPEAVKAALEATDA